MQLTEETFLLFAAKHYDNPFCLTEEEFHSDVYKISTLKKLLTVYQQDSSINIKLVVNTLIGIFNVFDHQAAKSLIQFKLDEKQFDLVNSFLLYLSYPTINSYFDQSMLIKIREEYK